MVRSIMSVLSRLVFLVGCLLMIACDESDKENLPNYSLSLLNDSIEMAIGKESVVEFLVSPSESEFVYDINSPNSDVRIVLDDGGMIPSYLKVDRVEKVLDESNNPIQGRYKVYIKDLSLRTNYAHNFILSINIGGGQFIVC